MAWSAIECYKKFVPLIHHQLVIGWIGKAHGPTYMQETLEHLDNLYKQML